MNGDHDSGKQAQPSQPTALRIFATFALASGVTLGGGYAIVPVMGHALEKRGWMNEDEFHQVFAVAQTLPGPIALSTAVLCSVRLLGFAGAAAAFLGVIVPPFFAIVVAGSLIGRFGQLPAVLRFLDGAGATVPGIVAALVWKTAKKRSWTVSRVVWTVALAVALAVFPQASLPIMLSGLAAMYFWEVRWNS